MQGVGMDDLGLLPGDVQNVALCRVKLQQPVPLPLFKLFEVIYQTNGEINYYVFCEKPDLGKTCLLWEVIDEQAEDDRSED